jgi:hypothetical protein
MDFVTLGLLVLGAAIGVYAYLTYVQHKATEEVHRMLAPEVTLPVELSRKPAKRAAKKPAAKKKAASLSKRK